MPIDWTKSAERKVAARAPGWRIVDALTGKPYILRSWPTQTEAHLERRDLLRGYPPGSEWHQRLRLEETR